MKKSILNLGKALNRAEQKQVNGGRKGGGGCCNPADACCTTNDLAGNPVCGVTNFMSGCEFQYADPSSPGPYPYVNCCI